MKIPKNIDTREELEVIALQAGLQAYGAKPGPLDGKRGPRTETALNYLWSMIAGQQNVLPSYATLAHSYVGEVEVPGGKANKTILGWIQGFFPWAKDDGELAWCAIFINTMLKATGVTGTNKANARSFLNWGKKVTTPHKGDIVVFYRGDPKGWKGHVGIYWGEAGSGKIFVLGGNQRDSVSVSKYSKSKILGYRRQS